MKITGVKTFIDSIPEKEKKYLLRLNEFHSPYISEDGKFKSDEEYINHTFFVSQLWNLQHIVSTYDKACGTLMDIDMECYPEIHKSQEKVCDLLVKAYYKEKDLYHDFLGDLDIYNPDIKGMSPRDGMISIL